MHSNCQSHFASLPTKMFFTEYRRGIANVRFAERGAPSPWKDIEHYRSDNSTKWTLVFKLINHLLKSDEGPFPHLDKSSKELPELVFPEKSPQAGAKGKIVLYLEFTSLLEVLEQALMYEKLSYVCATGKTPSKKRTEAINQFMTDEDCRILILSSVGNAGLNLHAARFLIFLASAVTLILSTLSYLSIGLGMVGTGRRANYRPCSPATERARSDCVPSSLIRNIGCGLE